MVDFSFKSKPKPEPEKPVEKKIDETLAKIQDKVQLIDSAKKHPPAQGIMGVELTPAVYDVDLNTLVLAQLSDCPSIVIPMMIDHGIRVAVDIKNAYRPERRHLDFQYLWIIIFIFGFFAVVWIINMFFGLF